MHNTFTTVTMAVPHVIYLGVCNTAKTQALTYCLIFHCKRQVKLGQTETVNNWFYLRILELLSFLPAISRLPVLTHLCTVRLYILYTQF